MCWGVSAAKVKKNIGDLNAKFLYLFIKCV